MTLLAQFLVYNVLTSLAAGLLAWLIVMAAVRLLDLRSSALSFCFLSLPLFKSFLILLGVGLVFPWPAPVFEKWHALALPLGQLLPFLVIWVIGIGPVYRLIVRKARHMALRDARPAAEVAPRLEAAFEPVLAAYRRNPCPACSDDLCGVVEQKRPPRLMVSERLDSPLALTDGGEPVIVFPAHLVSDLEETELTGALAHEMAHFILRRPSWCSAGTLQKLTLINPVAGLAAEYLHRQEEKACDDWAVSVTGRRDLYAGMLTKSYRFARQQAGRTAMAQLSGLSRLVGFKPLLSERVEHVLAQPRTALAGWRQPRLVVWLVWTALFSVLFFNWFR
jgi:Zn-dependent protease with chaperone function